MTCFPLSILYPAMEEGRRKGKGRPVLPSVQVLWGKGVKVEEVNTSLDFLLDFLRRERRKREGRCAPLDAG